jgi:hypothetical protein
MAAYGAIGQVAFIAVRERLGVHAAIHSLAALAAQGLIKNALRTQSFCAFE